MFLCSVSHIIGIGLNKSRKNEDVELEYLPSNDRLDEIEDEFNSSKNGFLIKEITRIVKVRMDFECVYNNGYLSLKLTISTMYYITLLISKSNAFNYLLI